MNETRPAPGIWNFSTLGNPGLVTDPVRTFRLESSSTYTLAAEPEDRPGAKPKARTT